MGLWMVWCAYFGVFAAFADIQLNFHYVCGNWEPGFLPVIPLAAACPVLALYFAFKLRSKPGRSNDEKAASRIVVFIALLTLVVDLTPMVYFLRTHEPLEISRECP